MTKSVSEPPWRQRVTYVQSANASTTAQSAEFHNVDLIQAPPLRMREMKPVRMDPPSADVPFHDVPACGPPIWIVATSTGETATGPTTTGGAIAVTIATTGPTAAAKIVGALLFAKATLSPTWDIHYKFPRLSLSRTVISRSPWKD